MSSRTPSNKAAALLLGVAAAVAAPTAHAQAGRSEPIIAIGALPQLDAWASGALGPTNGGLPPTLWRNSDPMALSAAFDALPQSFGSPTATQLALRALQSSGRAPEGLGALEAVRKRYAALGKLGAADGLSSMVTGQAAADPAIAQFGAQADLARGQDGAACNRVDSMMRGEPIAPFALRMRAFCLARAGDAAGAELAIEIARQANAADPFLLGAVQALIGPSRTPAPAGRFDTSFNVALSLAAGLKPGANALNATSSLGLIRIARDPAAPANLRYGAAVMGLRFGLIDAAAAREAIRASLTAAPPAAPARKGAKPAPKPTVVQPLALALQTIDAAPAGAAKARALAAALRRADTPGAFLATARLFRAELATVTPGSDLSDVAAILAKAALTLNDAQIAAAWRPYTPSNAGPALDAALAAAGAGPFAAMLTDAIDQRIAASAGAAPAAARDVRILEALGGAPSTTAVAFARANAGPATAKIDPAQVAALSAAQAKGAVGETALRAALILGDGAQRLDADTLATVIGALRAVGLDAEARAVAVEAMAPALPG